MEVKSEEEDEDIKPFQYGYPQFHLASDKDTSPGQSRPLQTAPHLQRDIRAALAQVPSLSYKYLMSDSPRKPRVRVTDEMKRQIIAFHTEHPILRQGEIADIFGIDRTTVTKLLKRNRTEQASTQVTPTPVAKRQKTAQYELEDMMYRWITRSVSDVTDWTDDQLLKQAAELQAACNMKMRDFSPNQDWLNDFKIRFRLSGSPPGPPADIVRKSSGTPDRQQANRRPMPRETDSCPQPLDLKMSEKETAFSRKTSRESPQEPVTTSKDLEKQSTSASDEKAAKVEDLNDQEALNRDMMSLEKFREQQKAIEEANKQKKALLSKTLTERKKQAQKEAFKLEHIQKELSKLDHLLTADVQVIRDKIEDASRDFMEAQKRFEKAEAEYVASKVDLHSKAELKEQLTEHLYTIIHQNEVRKAKKLAALMKELEMESTDEDLTLPELPPLTSFQPSTVPLSPTGLKHVSSPTSSSGDASTVPTSSSSSSSVLQQTPASERVDTVITDKMLNNNPVDGSESQSDKHNSDAKESVNVSEDKSDLTAKEEDNVKSVVSSSSVENAASDSPTEKPPESKEISSEKIKVGQTDKLIHQMRDNVNKELKTVDNLLTGDNKDADVTTEKLPSKWDFDGTVS